MFYAHRYFDKPIFAKLAEIDDELFLFYKLIFVGVFGCLRLYLFQIAGRPFVFSFTYAVRLVTPPAQMSVRILSALLRISPVIIARPPVFLPFISYS